MTDDTTETTGNRATAVAELTEARHPAERHAALMLAAAQRDLRIAQASSPAKIADYADVTDPEAEYAAWLARMVEHEQWAHESALRSVVAGYAFDRTDDRATRPLGEVTTAAIRRARAAIAMMTGPDQAAARAAGHDVLKAWSEDDRLALAAAGFPDPAPVADGDATPGGA